MANIAQIKLPDGTTYDIADKTSGYITGYTETDPIFSASAAAGITATDISNWDAKVSDDKTWKGVGLETSIANTDVINYVPAKDANTLTGNARWFKATPTPTAYAIAKYNKDSYLISTTPSANDNSTKVATTAYVDAAISGAGAGTITKVKTTAGAHTTIDVSSGAAEFNVPTKTSHLTNDSGYVTTDTKNTAGSTNSTSKLYLIGATEQTANSQTYSNSNVYIESADYDEALRAPQVVVNSFYANYNNEYHTNYMSFDNWFEIVVDNTGFTIDNGLISLYTKNNNVYKTYVYVDSANETLALTNLVTPTNDADAATKKYVDDSIPTVPTISLNGSTTTSPSFYAPTTAGANGQVLISSGSGAPTWKNIGFSNITTDSATITLAGQGYSFSRVDEKLKTSALGVSTTTYYPVLTTNTTSAETKKYSTLLQARYKDSNYDIFNLRVGNGVGVKGRLQLSNSGSSGDFTTLTPNATGDTAITLPSTSGTLALTSDIPTVPTNVSAFTNDAGYLTAHQTIPVTDVKMNGSSIVSGTSANITDSSGNVTFNGTVQGNLFYMDLATSDSLYTAIGTAGWTSAVIV